MQEATQSIEHGCMRQVAFTWAFRCPPKSLEGWAVGILPAPKRLGVLIVPNGFFCVLGVLVVRTLPVGVDMWAGDFWKLPNGGCIGCS